jgi:hypothetical protein
VTKYDDGLTEEQWLMAVDADDDSIEAAIARKEARLSLALGRRTTTALLFLRGLVIINNRWLR